jgi:thiamine monophosphate synthase
MTTMSLSDGPVVLGNLGVLIEAASDLLADINRDQVEPDAWRQLMKAQSLLGIAHSTCEMTVEAIESGPDYVLTDKELGA